MSAIAFLIANWRLILAAAGIALLVGGFFWIRADAREEGRQEIRAQVKAVVDGQRSRVQDATIKALEKVNAEKDRRLAIYRDAIKKIRADCRVDPAVIDAIRKLREGAPGPTGRENRPKPAQ